MKKFAWLMIISLFAVAFLVGCGAGSNNEAAENDSVTEDAEQSTSVVTDEETTTSDPDTPVSSKDEENGDNAGGGSDANEGEGSEGQSPGFSGVELLKEEVIFVGLADPHTIEVKTSEGYIALQVDPGLAEELGELSSDTPLTIEYYQNEHGQYVLTDYQVK